jgi:hypothetical protein
MSVVKYTFKRRNKYISLELYENDMVVAGTIEFRPHSAQNPELELDAVSVPVVRLGQALAAVEKHKSELTGWFKKEINGVLDDKPG